MDSGILMIQDSILVCSPDPRIPHTALTGFLKLPPIPILLWQAVLLWQARATRYIIALLKNYSMAILP
jgi:hypothetical protein